ncbi:MAG: single-stranded-DNA-specific exonuclease RecJ [Legionella sp.]|nr:single-stranded-DNA-specific exonuclease RecJ [Legionella sp.]
MLIKQRPKPAHSLNLPNTPDVLKRIYATRGITDASQLDKQLQTLLPFNLLKGIDAACVRLETALRGQQRILIIGDFDADGATSTALAITALRAMGAKFIDYLVPNRFEFGYGLTPQIVEVASKWKPNLIITVDNGIASFDGVEKAHELGIDVLITDHHLPAETVPNACAIVNPNQQGCEFPSKSIAGVGVIFYVMLALRRHLSNAHWFSEQNIPEPNMASFLDLVALGTVADVVGLDQNNRIMVNQGMARIRQGHCRDGIKALIEVAGRECSRLRESDLGFAIAPRLNAAGRLDDMALGIECLITTDLQQARNYCQQLDELNQERKQIESEMKEQAMLALDKLSIGTDYNTKQLPIALCLFDKTWHQGVIGILAGRIKERHHRPVIAFAAVDGDELKGSARSVPDLNIRDVLAEIDKKNPGLITKFGGHAMAAGLSMPLKSLTAFREALVAEVNKHLDVSQCEGELLTDGPLQAGEFSLDTAQLIHQAGPWGQQFAEPVFDNVFEVLDQRLVGKNHLKMTLVSDGQQVDAIAFNVDLNCWPNHRARYVHAAYKLDINFFQGRTRLQLLIQAMSVSNQ